jgi:hypothetical protein
MPRLIKTIVAAVIGGLVFGALTFAGGFGLAWLLGKEAQQALGMVVPMLFVPAAIVFGGLFVGWRTWRRA